MCRFRILLSNSICAATPRPGVVHLRLYQHVQHVQCGGLPVGHHRRIHHHAEDLQGRRGVLRTSTRPTSNWPTSVYRFDRRALTLSPQLCMGIQSGACFPARSADALPATLYRHFTQVIYRNRQIEEPDPRVRMRIHPDGKPCSDLGRVFVVDDLRARRVSARTSSVTTR
jgi:hypothetical protein